MNTMLKTLQFRAETTETLCATHHIPLMEIAGHRLCKLCQRNRSSLTCSYENELQQRLLQQKIKNSGLNKRYLDRGFKNYVVACPAQDNTIKLCQAFAQQIISDHNPNMLMMVHRVQVKPI
jgi:DNA replication protein DnaC